MGKNIKIIATVVPQSLVYLGGEYCLKLSVVLTPRIQRSGLLQEFEEMCQWWEYARFFRSTAQLEVYSELDRMIPLSIDRDFVPDRETVRQYWNAMFDDNTPVSRWLFSETVYKLVEGVTQSRLWEAFEKGINECIEQLLVSGGFGDTGDPTLTDGQDDKRLMDMASFVGYLQGLKKKRSTEQVLLDPILTDHRYRPHLKALHDHLQAVSQAAHRQMRDTMLELDIEEVEKRNFEQMQEFHKRLSAYANHDQVLRQTNMILDYTCSSKNLGELLNRKVYLRLGNMDTMFWPGKDAEDEDIRRFNYFMNELDFVYPMTVCRLNVSAPDPARPCFKLLEKSTTAGARMEVDERNGYILRKGGSYQLNTHGVDKAQLIARVETILKANFESDQVAYSAEQRNMRDVVGHENTDLSRQATEGAPVAEYVTSGLSLDITNLLNIVVDAVADNPEKQNIKDEVAKKAEGYALLYRHHLMAGYRVDVAGMIMNEDAIPQKGSLCVKNEVYQSAEFTACHKGTETMPYEGWLSENAQGATSGKQYIDEELFRWNDENLVAARFGSDWEDNGDRFRICVLPMLEKAIPLRFGWKYAFALRAVDIAGRGQSPVDLNGEFADAALSAHLRSNDDTHLLPHWTPPVYYQRVESVNSPIVYLGHRITRKEDSFASPAQPLDDRPRRSDDKKKNVLPGWLNEHWGEDLTTMVIRSEVINRELKPKKVLSMRYLAPPRVSMQFATQHSQFDDFYRQLKKDFPDTGSLSRSQWKMVEALKDEFLDAADVEEERQFDKVADGDRLSHMYDPAACGYELIVDDVVIERDWEKARSQVYDYYRHKYWLHVLRYRLELRSDPPANGMFECGEEGKTTYFKLLAGTVKTVEAGCRLKDEINGVKMEDCFMPGVPRTRRVALQLVHAVQHPCLVECDYSQGGRYAPEIDMDVSTVARQPGASIAACTFEFSQFPVLTADVYALHIQYFDWVCDPYTKDGFRITAVSKLERPDILPDASSGGRPEEHVRFTLVENVFDDTRFRKAVYKVEAVSRFKKFFPPGTEGGFSVFGQIKEKNGLSPYLTPEDVKREDWTKQQYKDKVELWSNILNTKSPEPPRLGKIVPVMRCECTDNGMIRHCDTIRIYLGDEWYSSGVDEQLAIFYLNKENGSEFNSGHIMDPVKEISFDGVISQFGADPAASEQKLKQPPNADDFDAFFKVNPGQVRKTGIDVNALQFENPSVDVSFKVSAIICDVNFHPGPKDEKGNYTKGEFYVDVKLDTEKMAKAYFPFVRFAVARYQENSLNGCEFSKVIATDFVQLLPYRKLTAKRAMDRLSITLETPTYRCAYDTEKKRLYNEVYLFTVKDEISGQAVNDGRIWKISEEKFERAEVNGSQVNLSCKDYQGRYMVAEYEVYEEQPVKGLTVKSKDPRANYTRRLVFSAFIDPKNEQNAPK